MKKKKRGPRNNNSIHRRIETLKVWIGSTKRAKGPITILPITTLE